MGIMAKLALLTTGARLVWSSDSEDLMSGTRRRRRTETTTDVSEHLMGEIAGSGDGGVYTGGKGVLVRTPDFFDGNTAVVPASLWSNDIFTPSPIYPTPTADPMCPTSGDGWSNLQKDCSAGHPWDRAVVAVVISSSLPDLMTDWDNVQDSDWGWGVFYAFDANSADKRCLWREDWNGWDCPQGFIDADGTFTKDDSKGGSGAYGPGNPYTEGDGGGSGCHFDGNAIDQMDASGMNLVQDPTCQCEYGFNDNWEHWVEMWMSNGYQKPGFEWRGWFGSGKAPTWGVDASICWLNNFRDMINLQNALYWHAYDWSNQMVPQSSWGSGSDQDRRYWGWNEVPVSTSMAEDPANWDSVIIKLPADICGNGGDDDHFECMGQDEQHDLAAQLTTFEKAGKLLTGIEHVTDRPGSYILFVREYRVDGGWNRYFFCRPAIIGDRQIQTLYEACYYDTYEAPLPPAPSCDCSWTSKKGACDKSDGSVCWKACCPGASSTEFTV